MVSMVEPHALWLSGLKSAYGQKPCVINSSFEKPINYHNLRSVILHMVIRLCKWVTYSNIQC